MKNKILTFVAIVAIGVGAYVYKQQIAKTQYNVLDYVPADTPIFAGEIKPFPIKKYLSSGPKTINLELSKKLDIEYKESKTAQEKFFLSLKKTYHDNLNDADKFTKIFGLANNVRFYFYTLGLVPVFKVEVAHPQAIWSLLDMAEKRSGYSHTNHKLKTVNYRSYSLHIGAVSAELVIAINHGLLTVTLNTPYINTKLLENALGITKVEKSLQDSNVLEEIIKQHGFKGAGVGFINHVEIIKGLTTKNGNQLAHQLTILAKLNSNDSSLAVLRSAECEKDFSSIAKNWPRTVIGYTDISIKPAASTLAFSTIVESKNKVILNALIALQGNIPNYTKKELNDFIFSIGLGLNVAKISNSITTIWHNIQTPKYTCSILANLQKNLDKHSNSLSMIGVGANIIGGVKGVSFSLLDYAIHVIKNKKIFENLDFILSITADDPEQLFNSMKMKISKLKDINITKNGHAVDIGYLYPQLLAYKTKPKLAIKGKYIIVYAGKKSALIANHLAKEALTNNVLYNMTFDLKRLVDPIIESSKLTGKSITEDLMFITEHDIRMKESFKITPQGIVIDSYISHKLKK